MEKNHSHSDSHNHSQDHSHDHSHSHHEGEVHSHSGSHHHHHHDHGDMKGWKLGVSILLNVLITVGQVIGALISGSVSLMTDALHNFSDVISLIISFIANRLTAKESTNAKTYGYKRAEILAAFINSATLIGVAIYLVIEAITRFSEPVVIDSNIVIWFAFGSIIINFLSVVILHNDAKDNMNIRSAYLHLLTDVMTSIAVMIGGFMMKYYSVYWLDSVLSMMIALYLIYSSYFLLMESTKVLMQFTPQGIDVDNLSEEIKELAGVKNIHHLHIWQLDDKKVMLEAHLEMDSDIKISGFQSVLSEVESVLKDKGINHFNIQPEIGRCENDDLIAH